MKTMETHLSNLDLNQLKALYVKANAELKMALLDGAPWSNVKDKRTAVTTLAILIHNNTDNSENDVSDDRPSKWK